MILTEIKRNEDLLTVLDFVYEQLFSYFYFLQQAPEIKRSFYTMQVEHQSEPILYSFKSILFSLVFYELCGWFLNVDWVLVPIFVNDGVLEEISALFFTYQ